MNKVDAGYFSSFGQIQQIVSDYDNLTAVGLQSNSSQIQEIISNLTALKQVLEQQEKAFYNRLGLSGYSNLKGCTTRAEEWSRSNAHRLLDQDFITTIYYKFLVYIDMDRVGTAFEKFLQTQTAADFLPNGEKTVLDLLQSIMPENSSKFRTSSLEQIKASFNIVHTGEEFKIVVTGSISEHLKRKILGLLNPFLDEADRVAIPKNDYATILQEVRKEMQAAGITGEIYNRINYEFTDRAESYNKAPNRAVVQGWLGEVYWNAKMNYLLNTTATYPVGDLKNERGKSASVDMIIDGTGFQIKSWSIKEIDGKKTHTSLTYVKLGTMLESRAQIMNKEIGRTIAKMFGAISYNKPNPEHMGDEYENYQAFYTNSMLPKQENPYALEKVMNLYLNKIISIDNGGTLRDPPIGLKSEYYNTFWLINDEIIPSSLIVQNIIERAQNAATSSLVEIQVQGVYERKTSPIYPNKLNEGEDLVAMANRWAIEYETTFDFNNIMQSIQNSIKA